MKKSAKNRFQPKARATRLLIAMLGAIVLAPAAAAETIYRCDQADGSVIFSDSPCDDQGVAYQAGNTLSVVEAPTRLAERIEENRAFIEQRRERLIQQRRPDESTPDGAERAVPPDPSQPLLQVPYWPPQPIDPPTPAPPVDREPAPGDDDFSALSGPFPGTTRRRDAPAEDPDSQ